MTSPMTEAPKWHLRVNGEPACSSRALVEDRRLPLVVGSCCSDTRESIERVAAEVRRLYPHLSVEVVQDGCGEGLV